MIMFLPKDEMEPINEKQSYVIFDGACGFCNSSAMFIARRDVLNRFILVSNVSDLGKELLKVHKLENTWQSSIILIDEGAVSVKSKAIRTIFTHLSGFQFLKFLLRITPLFIQNLVYDGIAEIRKSLPVNTNCEIPEQEVMKKFRL